MYELIKSNLEAYAFAAAFLGLWILLVIWGTIKKTKNLERKSAKAALRFGISGVLIGFWAWFFIYVNLYPISLAYYEYSHNLTEEKIGVIKSVEQEGKDRIRFIIDDTEYTMVDSSTNPFVVIGWDVDEGDTVKIKYGASSKYIFDICKANTDS